MPPNHTAKAQAMKSNLAKLYQILFTDHAQATLTLPAHTKPLRELKQFFVDHIPALTSNHPNTRHTLRALASNLDYLGLTPLKNLLLGEIDLGPTDEEYASEVEVSTFEPEFSEAELSAYFKKHEHLDAFLTTNPQAFTQFKTLAPLFEFINFFMEEEGDSLRQAYKFLIYFKPNNTLDSLKAFDAYLEQFHSEDEYNPVSHALRFKLPNNSIHPINLEAWRNLILTHGPDALELMQIAPEIEAHFFPGEPLDYDAVVEADIEVKYPKADQHPELATLCYHYKTSNDYFNRSLDLHKHLKTEDAMPALSLSHNSYWLVTMPLTDPQIFLLGHLLGAEGKLAPALTQPDLCLYIYLKPRNAGDTAASPIVAGRVDLTRFDILGVVKATTTTSRNLLLDYFPNYQGQHQQGESNLALLLLQASAEIVNRESSPHAQVSMIQPLTREFFQRGFNTLVKDASRYRYNSGAEFVVLATNHAKLKAAMAKLNSLLSQPKFAPIPSFKTYFSQLVVQEGYDRSLFFLTHLEKLLKAQDFFTWALIHISEPSTDQYSNYSGNSFESLAGEYNGWDELLELVARGHNIRLLLNDLSQEVGDATIYAKTHLNRLNTPECLALKPNVSRLLVMGLKDCKPPQGKHPEAWDIDSMTMSRYYMPPETFFRLLASKPFVKFLLSKGPGASLRANYLKVFDHLETLQWAHQKGVLTTDLLNEGFAQTPVDFQRLGWEHLHLPRFIDLGFPPEQALRILKILSSIDEKETPSRFFKPFSYLNLTAEDLELFGTPELAPLLVEGEHFEKNVKVLGRWAQDFRELKDRGFLKLVELKPGESLWGSRLGKLHTACYHLRQCTNIPNKIFHQLYAAHPDLIEEMLYLLANTPDPKGKGPALLLKYPQHILVLYNLRWKRQQNPRAFLETQFCPQELIDWVAGPKEPAVKKVLAPEVSTLSPRDAFLRRLDRLDAFEGRKVIEKIEPQALLKLIFESKSLNLKALIYFFTRLPCLLFQAVLRKIEPELKILLTNFHNFNEFLSIFAKNPYTQHYNSYNESYQRFNIANEFLNSLPSGVLTKLIKNMGGLEEASAFIETEKQYVGSNYSNWLTTLILNSPQPTLKPEPSLPSLKGQHVSLYKPLNPKAAALAKPSTPPTHDRKGVHRRS